MRKVKLKDITAFVRNGKSIKNSSDNVGLPITRIETISDGSFNPKKLGYGGVKNLEKIGDYWLQDGDILMSHINSPKHLGKSAIFKNNGLDVIHGMNLLCIRPQKKAVSSKYLNYFFSSKYFYRFIKSISNQSVNQASFAASKLKKLEIPLPSLDEQKAIVAKLERAQRLIDLDREMLAKYDDLIQSVFLDMFGDPRSNSQNIRTGKLGNFAFINMGQSPKGLSYNEKGIGEPLLNGPTEFGEKYPAEKQWTTEPKKFAEKDDILFCVRGATAGRTNLADKKYCIGRGLAAIRGEVELDTSFILFILKSHYDHFQSQGQGSTFINISKDDLANLEVPIPSREKQNEFIDASEKIELQKQVTEDSFKKTKELFLSLIQEVFG